ncbi:hypothetical protein [Microbulbifer elongatus]|uniref:hypothetical protein n=1 Tax=Microbulbifer elongatus TaxID=86173 RepID=UPI001CFE2F86|nr:hypothetical protein [Microbulbifer elongatus]
MNTTSELESILANKDLLRPYAAFIHAPPCLQALIGVSETFLAMTALPGFDGFPTDAQQYIPVAREIVSRCIEIAKFLPRLAADRQNPAVRVLHGIIGDYPIYALLYFRCSANWEGFLRLQQAILAAKHTPLGPEVTLKHSDFQSFGLAVRQISEVSLGRSWLESLDQSELCSLQCVKDKLRAFPNWIDDQRNEHSLELTKKEKRLINQVKNAHLLLNAVTGDKIIRKNLIAKRSAGIREALGTRGRSDVNPHDFMEIRVLGDADDPQEYPEVWALCRRPDNENTKRELEYLGVESDEATDRLEFIFLSCRVASGMAEAVQAKFAARGAAKKIEMQNQFLPMSTQCLNDEDLKNLTGIMSNLSEAKEQPDLGLVLRVMLATSSSATRAQKMRVLQSNGDIPAAGTIAYDLTTSEWLVPVHDLEFKTVTSEACNGVSRLTSDTHLRLPDLFHFGQRLLYSFRNSVPDYPFIEINWIEEKLRNKVENKEKSLTLARIERAIIFRVASQVEPTQATFMLDKYLPPSSARRYYTAISVSKYRDVYAKACAEIASITSGKKITASWESHSREIYIGARYCPFTDHIRDVVGSMKSALKSAKACVQRGKTAWIKFHNLYTIYAIYTQGFVTAIRSIVEPFVNSGQMSQSLGIAIFRDKGCDDEFHTRTVPLHSLTVDIAREYERHRSLILNRLEDAGRIKKNRTSENDLPSIFLINQDGVWVEARPSAIVKHLNQFTPLPLNSNRKYVRTRLLEMGVSPHAVDTLMGHANRGEAFWEHSSTSCFYDLKKEILAGLDEIVIELGLCVVRGIIR